VFAYKFSSFEKRSVMPIDSSQTPCNHLDGTPEVGRPLLENPYAITHDVESEGGLHQANRTPASLVATILLWTVVCSLSAAPSFFWANGEVAKDQDGAMVLGVVVFIGIYSAADLLSRGMLFRQNAQMRSILRATFMVRSVMVVIFPVALTTDLFLGMFSVSFVEYLVKPFHPGLERKMSFGVAFATTLVQGGLLSIFLFFLGLLISAIVFLIRSLTIRVGRG
jgi:hypothetical protein